MHGRGASIRPFIQSFINIPLCISNLKKGGVGLWRHIERDDFVTMGGTVKKARKRVTSYMDWPLDVWRSWINGIIYIYSDRLTTFELCAINVFASAFVTKSNAFERHYWLQYFEKWCPNVKFNLPLGFYDTDFR